MKSWKTLLSDKRWLILLGIIAFAVLASWCESRTRRGEVPRNVAGGAEQNSGERRAEKRDQPQLPEEFEGTTAAVEQLKPEPAPTGPVTLKRIRTGAHDDYDRVVFDFEGDAPPGFHIEYVDKLTRKCGSDELKVAGSTWLLVRLTPALAHAESGKTSLYGMEFDEDLSVIKGVRQVCDTEGQLEWLIEVADRKPYRAVMRTEPARFVVDVKH